MMRPRLTGNRNECPTCHELFNSIAAFDKHRTGRFGVDRRCRTVAEMVEVGMLKNEAGFWIGEAFRPFSQAEKQAEVAA